MKILRAADYRTMPWKNGGGTTTEVAVWPPNASLDDFLWRVSMAGIETSGPFSIFPGVDRSLTILEGDGIILEIQGRQPVGLTCRSDPLSFPADLPASASLIGDPVSDLNVMSRRGHASHRMTVLEPENGLELEIEAPQALLFCIGGVIIASSEAGEARFAQLDTLLLDPPPQRIRMAAELRSSTVALIQFWPAPSQTPAT